MIINLFCDASIDLSKKIACGGCISILQDATSDYVDSYNIIGNRMILQEDATNNSAEILAIWIGIVEALRLRQIYPGAIFRLFSDSKISLYGVRDWMKNWIRNMRDDGVLISSSGQPVMNQQKFIEIYNLIVENNLRIEFYHQRGHVTDGKISMEKARVQFIKANKVPPEGLGLTMEYLCFYNNMIDGSTRNAVRNYVDNGIIIDNTEVEGCIPMEYQIRKNMSHQYIRYIDKCTIKSRHDFKGGYNQ